MIKKKKKTILKSIISMIMVVTTLMALSLTCFAAERPQEEQETGTSILPKDIGEYTVDAILNDNSKATRAWPGSGPAAQVSDVQIWKTGSRVLDKFPGHEGHFGVVVRVIGHGRDDAKWDGSKVKYFQSEPIILSGTLVDGWYNYYDLGFPNSGSHKFEVLMRSTNPPYTEMSAWKKITIE